MGQSFMNVSAWFNDIPSYTTSVFTAWWLSVFVNNLSTSKQQLFSCIAPFMVQSLIWVYCKAPGEMIKV